MKNSSQHASLCQKTRTIGNEFELSNRKLLFFSISGKFTLLSALAIAISYADRSNISTAIIPMSSQFRWETSFSGFVLSSFWAGYAFSQIFGGKLADKIGGETILMGALLVWSAFTAITPSAAFSGKTLLIFSRTLLGFGEGLALPAIHSMIKKYVHPNQRSTSAAFITSSCFAGTLLSNLLSPWIIGKFGWKACFYSFSIVPLLVWTPLWILFLRAPKPNDLLFVDSSATNTIYQANNTYSNEKNVSNNKLINQKTEEEDMDAPYESPWGLTELTELNCQVELHQSIAPVPIVCKIESAGDIMSVQHLLTFPSVWAIIVAQYGQSWGMTGLLSWLPTYYSDTFKVPVASLNSFTVLPYFLQMVTGILAGFVADKLISLGCKKLWVRHGFQFTGMLVPALCLSLCVYFPGMSVEQTAIMINVGTAASALTSAAVSCNHFDLSPRNAGTIFAIGNTIGCIGGFIAVPVSGYLFELTNSWDIVFVLFSAHYVIGAIVWGVLASDRNLQPEKN